MAEYDEDEERRPVYFEQDPDSDDIGDGYFTYADGRREYGSSHEDATALEQAGKAAIDKKPGGPAFAEVDNDTGTGASREVGGPAQGFMGEYDPAATAPVMPEPEEEEAEPLDMAPEPAPMPELAQPELPQLDKPLPLAGQGRSATAENTASASSSRATNRSAMPLEVQMAGQQAIRDTTAGAVKTQEAANAETDRKSVV